MWIVIDTNIFYNDFRINKSLDILFREIENLPISLRIPEVVVRETVNKYENRCRSLRDKTSKSVTDFNLLTQLNIEVQISDEDLQNSISEYERFLRNKIARFGEIIPLPAVTVDEIVNKAVAKRKPFKEGGSGFRDALIWENVLGLASMRGTDEIVFISENTKDFSDTDKANLHPELIQDLDGLGENIPRVFLFTTLKDFIREKIEPDLQILNDIRAQIIQEQFDFDAYADAEGFIWDLLVGFSVDSDCLPDYREDNSELMISTGVSDYSPMFDELIVQRLSEHELLITIPYEMDCELDVFVPQWELYTEKFRDQGFYVNDQSWNKTVALCGIVLPFQITLRYIFDEQTSDITSADIISAECE